MNKSLALNIINSFDSTFKSYNYAEAFWIEGSYSNDSFDDFSNLNLWFKINNYYILDFIKELESCLIKYGGFDKKKESMDQNNNLMLLSYHLSNTNQYFTLEISVFGGEKLNLFVRGDKIRQPKVIFDKNEVVKYCDRNEYNLKNLRAEYLECCDLIESSSICFKYYNRNDYFSGVANYEKYFRDVVIRLLRILDTPNHVDLGNNFLVRDFSDDKQLILKDLFTYSSVEDLKKCSIVCLSFAKKLIVEIQSKYNF